MSQREQSHHKQVLCVDDSTYNLFVMEELMKVIFKGEV